ncbi:MAG: 16S rRNA (uracil(1498)-N(3))-methyltransferase [Spirochaetes bacterium]|nr:16S rRNA (uracil(1498)-N(3))-methyltransferase [Spirochaetota bacterium]
MKDEPDKGLVRLSGDDYHYLVRVRRFAPGEFFPALLPGGGEAFVMVQSVGGGVLTGRVGESHGGIAEDAPPAGGLVLPPVFLFQALPKEGKMDLIVRQAGEGAIAKVVPFASEFSLVKIKGAGEQGGKLERWRRIVREARQQSGSKVATEVCPPLSLDGLFSYWDKLKSDTPGILGLFFHHLPFEPAAVKSLHAYLEKVPPALAMTVGPEGGFSQREAERFLDAGFLPLTIGDTILRTETAALYCAAAVRIILLERDSWTLKQAKSGNV